MPLAEECRPFVDAVTAGGPVGYANRDPVEATLVWGAALALGSGGGPRVDHVDDLDADGVPVRVYRPDADEPLPLVLFFHGGGFTIGSVDSHDPIARAIANRVPAVVVSVNFRQGPKHRFPAAHDDAWTALQWAAEHAREIGADVGRIAVFGDSAGACLAVDLARRVRDGGGPTIRLQALWLPLVDARFDDDPSFLEFGSGYVLDRHTLHWFRHSYVDPSDYDDMRISPGREPNLAGLPRVFLATAECDPIRDQGEAFAARLRDAGVDVELIRYDGAYHPFYGMTAMFELARRLEDDTVAAMQKALV